MDDGAPLGHPPLTSATGTLEPTRYERSLDESGDGLVAAMSAASRSTRALVASTSPHVPAPMVEVTAGVAGPLLSGYVLWCFERAREAGCRRLYFVARDGEVLLDLARRLAAVHAPDLDLRYLEGSRRAWLVAGMAPVDVAGVAAVAGRSEVNTVRSLLDWVDVTPEEVADELAAAGHPQGRWDAPVEQGEVTGVLSVLEAPSVAPRVQAAAGRAAEAAGRYFDRVGLLDQEPYAIVEMEGRGNVGRLLEPVVRRAGGSPPAVECYFALVSPAPSPGRELVGYMYDEGRGTGEAERAHDVYVALEVFTAATHGGVRGYELDGEGARVRLASERNEAALAWGLAEVRRVLDVFAQELARALPAVDARSDVRGPTWAALRAFWVAPTREEVDVWGAFPFEDGELHYAIADGFSSREVLAGVLAGRPRLRRRGTWPAGVRMNAGHHLRLARRVARSLPRARRG